MSFSGTRGYTTKPKPGVAINPLHPLSRGLVGCWLFNEGGGNLANDISGNHNHGTLKNITKLPGSGWEGSKFGGGLSLDGTNDYVDCGDRDSLNVSTVTLSMWFKPISWDDVDKLITKYVSGNGYILEYQYGALVWDVLEGWNEWYIQIDLAAAGIESGVWCNLAATFDGSTIRIIVNGISRASGAAGGLGAANASFMIGADAAGTTTPNCEVDMVHVYDRALSSTELVYLYQHPFCNLQRSPIRRFMAPATGGRTTHNTRPSMNVHTGVLFQMISGGGGY